AQSPTAQSPTAQSPTAQSPTAQSPTAGPQDGRARDDHDPSDPRVRRRGDCPHGPRQPVRGRRRGRGAHRRSARCRAGDGDPAQHRADSSGHAVHLRRPARGEVLRQLWQRLCGPGGVLPVVSGRAT
ncbi:MAG: hypothetical protein FJX76_26030, partial [Armatimonadetes bacterium]|nr:hypothetical protein [Armatimonadota bacterium]